MVFMSLWTHTDKSEPTLLKPRECLFNQMLHLRPMASIHLRFAAPIIHSAPTAHSVCVPTAAFVIIQAKTNRRVKEQLHVKLREGTQSSVCVQCAQTDDQDAHYWGVNLT